MGRVRLTVRLVNASTLANDPLSTQDATSAVAKAATFARQKLRILRRIYGPQVRGSLNGTYEGDFGTWQLTVIGDWRAVSPRVGCDTAVDRAVELTFQAEVEGLRLFTRYAVLGIIALAGLPAWADAAVATSLAHAEA